MAESPATPPSMKPLSVAMVLSYDPSQAGGVQIHLQELSRALASRGHRITVFGPDRTPKFRFPRYRVIGQLVRAPSLYGNWSNIMIPIAGRDRYAQIITPSRFDICHVHDVTVPSVAWGILNQVRVPKVVTFHSTWDDESWLNVFSIVLRLVRPQFSNIVDGVINVSPATERKWKAIHDHSVLSRTIANGVPAGIVPNPARRDPSHQTILFLSRLVRNKGLMSLLCAYDRISGQFPRSRIVVVGDGQERESAVEYLRGRPWRRRVTFTGTLTGKEKIAAFQSADMFAAPYVDEAFGITVLEAMASGLPVVGFRNNSFTETLRRYPGKQLLVRPGDTGGLSSAIRTLLADQQQRLALGEWCLKESGKYSWERTAEKTETLYRAMLDKGHA